MREFKFRAWDKFNKIMIYSDKNYPLSEYKIEFDWTDENKLSLMKLIDARYGEFRTFDAVIMQYTEFKDKNGKEIYEGDIVEFYSLSEDGMTLGVVSYDEGMYIIGDYILRKHIRSCIVKGNIYENPELLK